MKSETRKSSGPIGRAQKSTLKNPRFREVRPNYRKGVLEVLLEEGRRRVRYDLPFSIFEGLDIGSRNRVVKITIDPELRDEGVVLTLQDGRQTSFFTDLILYHCDPTYKWSPLNQIRRRLEGKFAGAKLGFRAVADAFRKSPEDVLRTLEQHLGSPYFAEVRELAERAGYQVRLELTRKPRS
jgi:hypothetical protein